MARNELRFGILGPLEISAVNRPGMSGDSSSWKGWGHVRWFIEEVPAGAA
ncbi:PPE family protein [Mycobacterium tuberculosis]|nr:PPE family protein [Mycobacterium tuberculosis]